MNKLENDDKKHLSGFVDEYLRQDGVFVLRLVGHNTTAITVTEVVCGLWDHYLEEVKSGNKSKGIENGENTIDMDFKSDV